jgi:hypothetical protein
MIGRYINVGSNLSLEETSIQIRSWYADDLVIFNKDKKCGKFQFYVFAMYCVFIWTRLRLPVCTRKKDNVTDHPSTKGYEAVHELEKVNNIIVNMLSYYVLTNVVVNMETFYCSPTVAKMLAEHAIWCRGTIINKRNFPKMVMWANGEAKCGDYHIAVESKYGVIDGSWYGGVPVTFISMAVPSDGETTVTHMMDVVRQEVKSHIAIKRYNRFVQGVDRNHQLQVSFSLVARHAFKKYYIKYFLCIFDICMTNEMVHYFLLNSEEKKRYLKAGFFTKVANELCNAKKWDFKGIYGGGGCWKNKQWISLLDLLHLILRRRPLEHPLHAVV